MDQTLEVTNIKNEPTDSTSSDRLEFSPDMQVNTRNKDSDYLIHSEFVINTELQEDENEFPVITSTSYEICHYNDIKFETEEPLIKMEYEELENELMQDPLDVSSEIKVEEQFPINLGQGEARIKLEQTEGEINENLLEYDEDSELHGSASNLQDQLLIRNNSNCKDKKYACSECNKKFKKKWHLDRHLRIHTGVKPFICYVCNKTFSQKSTMDIHMFMHSSVKPHVCDVCKKFFARKSYLDTHMLIHSGAKLFSCDVCDKSFTQKPHLFSHKRTHTGEKPYTCDLCKKAFAVKSTLTDHRRTHTGEKPYSCEVCSESFTQKSGLNKHKRNSKH